MKILELDKDYVKIKITNFEDLWLLYTLLDKNTFVAGYTTRVLKGENYKEKTKVWLKIRVEEAFFDEITRKLKIRGRIVECPEEIPKGYHTFDVDIGSVIEIYKEFSEEEIKELYKAEKEKEPILLVSFDLYECAIALVSNLEYKILDYFESGLSKGEENYENQKIMYYNDIYKKIKEYFEKYNPKLIIISSPLFFKEELLNIIKSKDEKLAKRIKLIDVSYGGIHGIREALRRKEFLKILQEFEISKINELIQEILYRLSKQEKIAYGWEDVKLAIDSNAVETLIITEDFILKAWREDFIDELKKYIDKVRKQKANIFFVRKNSAENYDALLKLGGIVALLRYDLYF